MSVLVAGLGTGQVLWALVWSSLLALWLRTVVVVGSDIGRRDDLSGAGTGAWWLSVNARPSVGVPAYAVTRGGVLQDLDGRWATARRPA